MTKEATPGALGSNELLGPLPEPFCKLAVSENTGLWVEAYNNGEPAYDANQMRAYAATAVAAERDCRTCRNFRGTQHCHSVLRCVDGSSYKRGGVVQLWETAPVEPAPF